MKFLKPILLIMTVLALTYTVSAASKSFKGDTDIHPDTKELPLNGDIMFAFIAIASISTYLAFKK